MRWLPSVLIVACGPQAYREVDVDWSPSATDLCGLDPPPVAVLPGEWPGASPGYALALADLDGDGFAEIAYSLHAEDDYLTGGFRIHRGTAVGPEPTPWVDAWGAVNERVGERLVALGDVDGDGLADLAVSTLTFSEVDESEVSVTEIWSAVAGADPAPRAFHAPGGDTLASVDANGDGLGDLAVGTEGELALYLGAPGGPSSTASAVTLGTTDRFAQDLVSGVGDMDGDGHGDVVVADGADRLYLLPGAGVDGPAVEVADVGSLESLSGGDLDGDGASDLVAGWRNDMRGKIGWWPGGSASTAPAVEIAGADSESQQWFARAAPDWDGDGDQELVIGARGTVVRGAEYAGQIAIHAGGPGGPAPDPSFVVAATGARCFFGEQFELGDVDGDGVADLVGLAHGSTEVANEGGLVILHGEASWLP